MSAMKLLGVPRIGDLMGEDEQVEVDYGLSNCKPCSIRLLASGGPSARIGCNTGSISITGLSIEQVQCLLSLIDGPVAGYEKLSGNVSWMLDSGALTYMVGDATLLKRIEKKYLPQQLGSQTGHTL